MLGNDHRVRIVGIVGIVGMLCIPITATSQEVTAEKLLKKVPRLTPENKALKSFQCEVEYSFGPLQARIEVAWKRPGKFGILILEPKNRVPIAAFANKQVMFYDALTRSLTVGKDVAPFFTLEATKDLVLWKFRTGGGQNAEKKKPTFVVDLASIFHHVHPSPELKNIRGKIWQYKGLSPRKTAYVIGNFDLSQQWPLRRVEIRSVGDNELMLGVDIAVNKPVNKRLFQFPDRRCFPRLLQIKEEDFQDRKPAEQLAEVMRLLKAIVARVALREPELRTMPLLTGINWNGIKKMDRMVGPALRKLWKVPEVK